MEKQVLNFRETAAMVGLSVRSWSRHWKSYVRERGFPPPLPHTIASRNPKWSAAQVTAWIGRGGQPLDDRALRFASYGEKRHAA